MLHDKQLNETVANQITKRIKKNTPDRKDVINSVR